MKEKSLFGYDLTEIDNLNEEVVIEVMEETLEGDRSVCRCQLCIEDIFALSLNKLKPLYVQASSREGVFKEYDLTKLIEKANVEEAVKEAINRVSRFPHH